MAFNKILIANRGEIAIRVIRAAHELDIPAVAIFSEEDRLSLHRFNADEAHQVGKGLRPVQAYLDIDDILRIAANTGCDAIHPGYGFLAENPDFAEKSEQAGIIFIGPNAQVMRKLGNKVDARRIAIEADVPVIPASGPLSDQTDEIKDAINQVGLPVMLKASWGGGGRGMRIIRTESEIFEAVELGKREAQTYFGNDEVFFEKLVEDARHVEVQVLGDKHGNIVHLFERDCTLQRRHQKVLERAPAPFISDSVRNKICAAAVKLVSFAGLDNAATVEFLYDVASHNFYFIEVNPRIQVEHTVTEEITGIDLVKAQIRIAAGENIGVKGAFIPPQSEITFSGHAMQCRVTAEDPHNNFIPDYGSIIAYRSPAGPGVRLDSGTAYAGAQITRSYDSLLVKVTTRGSTDNEAIARMRRALSEFRVRGVATNISFLLHLLTYPQFKEASYNTRFIDETPDLFEFTKDDKRAEKILTFISNVIVNGNSQVKERKAPISLREPTVPILPEFSAPEGLKQKLQSEGAENLSHWLLAQDSPLITDTTFRDAHQSLLATRIRSKDMVAIAPHYARLMPQLFSVESWGGATFDVALRFLQEDPWKRLEELNETMPNIMQQMLLRASNAVGYKNYPDNVVRYFIHRAAETGVDVFRIFDSLNWVENMRVAIDAVGETGKVIEAAMCYTGDILDPLRSKYDLKYYLLLAKELEKTGAHILGIKDMAGLLKPAAAKILITNLKNEINIPIHFHTHDTSGTASATILAAVDAGVDIVDAAIDSMSGFTSQPNMGSIVEALRFTKFATDLDANNIRILSSYWEQVREQYIAFEADIHSGTSEVYIHEMPGGQYTNLREQARAMGVESRWPEIAQLYSDINQLFGDIIKVTPTSKVVGDMALAMITAGLTKADIVNPDKSVTFPDSVVGFFRGELGKPVGGFPEELQRKVLNDIVPISTRAGEVLTPVDFTATKNILANHLEREPKDNELASYLMYPDVYTDYISKEKQFSDVSALPTCVFFYGMQPGEEISIPIFGNKQAIVRFLATSEPDEDGMRRVFFELNGQPMTVIVQDNHFTHENHINEKADADIEGHVATPMPGLVVSVDVTLGQRIKRGDTLVILEAMKMQSTISSELDGIVSRIVARPDHIVDTKDLLMVIDVE